MSKVLPERIDIARLADTRATLVGSVPIGRFVRLAPALDETAGAVEVELRFGREDGREVIVGHIEGELALRCQRCLATVRLPVRATVDLARVASEAETVAGTHEPFVAATREVDLAVLVEDELILAVPLVPLHPDGARCRPASIGRGGLATNENPFAALAALKKH